MRRMKVGECRDRNWCTASSMPEEWGASRLTRLMKNKMSISNYGAASRCMCKRTLATI